MTTCFVSYSHWTINEIQIIKDYYPSLGAKELLKTKLLPGRTLGAIQQRAHRLGIYDRTIGKRKDRMIRIEFPLGFSDPLMQLAVCGKRNGN